MEIVFTPELIAAISSFLGASGIALWRTIKYCGALYQSVSDKNIATQDRRDETNNGIQAQRDERTSEQFKRLMDEHAKDRKAYQEGLSAQRDAYEAKA